MAAITTTKPTTDKQLESIAQHIPDLVPLFRGVLMRSEAAAARFARICPFVVNLADSPGTHWVAVYAPVSGPAKWIDSFGLPPSEDHPLDPRAAWGGWGWRLIHAGGSGTHKTEAILNLVAGDLPRAMRQHSDPKMATRWIRPDRIVLVLPNATELKYDLLADSLEYGDPEVSFERYAPEDEDLPTNFDAADRNLHILEDLSNAPKAFRDRVSTPAFTRLRHQGVSTIMTTQSYFDTDKGLRRNATHLALHPCGDDRALAEVVKQYAPKDAHGDVMRSVKAAHGEGGFAVFDSTAPHDSPRRFRLRWDRNLLTGRPMHIRRPAPPFRIAWSALARRFKSGTAARTRPLAA